LKQRLKYKTSIEFSQRTSFNTIYWKKKEFGVSTKIGFFFFQFIGNIKKRFVVITINNDLTVVLTATTVVTRRVSTDVFLGVCFKGFFASWSAEIVVFAFVDCFVFCSFLIHIHVAYQIFSHVFSPPPHFYLL